MKDNDIIKNEFINHSQYTPNEKIQVNKYITEHKRGIINSIAGSSAGETHLLIAQTGSGKTYSIINALKEFNIKAIFIVPNASNVEQIMREYDIPGAWGDISAEAQFDKGNVITLTWDKFAQLKDIDLSKYIAVVDEIHQTFTDMYRNEKIKGLYNNLDKCAGRIDITATPNKLDFEIYNYIVEYVPEAQTKYNVKLYNTINDNTVIDIINNSKKFALLENNTNNLQYYQECTSKKTDVVSRDFIDSNRSNTYDDIMRNSSIGDYQGILNTSVIVAGVNIYDSDITDIIIINEKDISTIKQYVARFRDLKEVNVHIFNKQYNQDMSNVYEVEWRIKQYIRETEKDIEDLNSINKRRAFRAQTLPIVPFKLENNNDYYYDKELREYKVDKQMIRNKCYSEYYRKADIVSFKELLMEYFKNIEIINIPENDDKPRKVFNMFLKEDKKNALEVLEAHKELLVGANELIKNKTNSDLDQYFYLNKLDREKILDEIRNKDIPELIKVGNIKKTIDIYTKYIVENKMTYNLAWLIANKGNRARGKFFEQINIQVFKKLEKNYPELIDHSLIENRLYNILTSEFKPGISYTSEHIEYFIEGLKIILPNLKTSEKEIREKLVNIYVVEANKVSKCPAVDTIFYKNKYPTPGQFKGKRVNIYTIKRHKKIADITEEYQLSIDDYKVLKNIISKRYKAIIESDEATELINIEKIFIS